MASLVYAGTTTISTERSYPIGTYLGVIWSSGAEPSSVPACYFGSDQTGFRWWIGARGNPDAGCLALDNAQDWALAPISAEYPSVWKIVKSLGIVSNSFCWTVVECPID